MPPTSRLLPNATHTSGCAQTVSQFWSVKPFQEMFERLAALNENTKVYAIGMSRIRNATVT